MAIKTYQIIIEEQTKWKLEVVGKNYSEAINKAVNEVADHEWGYFPMAGRVRYECVASCIKRKSNTGKDSICD